MTDPRSDTVAPLPLRRPTSVSAAAALVLCMGLFLCAVVGLPAALVLLFDPHAFLTAALSHDVGASTSAADWLLSKHGLHLSAFEGLLGVVSVACAVGLWIGRSWARRGSQVAMGLLVLLWLVVGGVVGFTYDFSGAGFPAGGAVRMLLGFLVVGMSTAWAIATGLPIWLLQRRDAAEWFQSRAA